MRIKNPQSLSRRRTTIVIPSHLFYSIDPENPIQVFLVGGIDKAAKRLLELVDKTLREWVTAPQKGPQKLESSELTLDRARQMSNEAINEILESLVNNDLTQIPSEIPTEALLGHFEGRPLSPKETEWIAQYEKKSDTEKAEIKIAAEKRLAEIAAVRNGDMAFAVSSVGLVVRQMVVDNIEPDKLTADQITKVAAERFAAEQRKIRTESLVEQANRFKTVTEDLDPLQAALIEEGTITQTNQVTKFELSPALTQIADGLAKTLGTAIADRISGGKEKS